MITSLSKQGGRRYPQFFVSASPVNWLPSLAAGATPTATRFTIVFSGLNLNPAIVVSGLSLSSTVTFEGLNVNPEITFSNLEI